MPDLYLSYTGRKTYITCPLKYRLRYVDREKVEDNDPKRTMFGLVVGKVFEWFYNKRFWAEADPARKCLEVSERAIDDVCDERSINRSVHRDCIASVREDLRAFVPTTIEVIREHRLLTTSSKSEVDLTVPYSRDGISMKLGGRADFVHRSGSVWIVDGKASAHRGKYVDADQLIWYALLHYIKYHVAPARLGFLYYRFPKDPVQWIVYDEQSLRRVLSQTFEIASLILNKNFEASPSGECRLCEFCPMCQDGTRYLAARRVSSGGRIGESIFDFDRV